MKKEENLMDWGMENRLNRLIQSDGHCFFLPIDHGYSQGPTSKLERPGGEKKSSGRVI
jgi:putative autoinducer-2 (AI-2) aldolase